MNTVVKMEAETPVVRWLDNNLARGLRAPFACRGTLTPELARVLLEKNDQNRTLSVKKVSQYASDIADGRWTLNGETIIVASDGHLNNGQHRCAAVLEAGLSAETFFVFGVARDSRLTVDQGVKRSVYHYLQMEGRKHSALLASAATLCEQYARLGRIARDQVRSSPAQTRLYVDANPDLAESVAFVSGRRPNIPMSSGVVAGLHHLFAQRDKVEADWFIEQMCSGAELPADDPVFTCRNKIMSMSHGRKRMPAAQQAECMIRAWNARREGRTLIRMQIGPNFPEIV